MTAISEAVILMAGQGSRLRDLDKTFLKPVVPLLGRPLISYTLDALVSAGIETVYLVVGYLLASLDSDFLNIAVDRKLGSIFDLKDAMKVQTRGNRVIDIGKDLRNYDAVDTGLLVCPLEIFNYLERSKRNGDCSLA